MKVGETIHKHWQIDNEGNYYNGGDYKVKSICHGGQKYKSIAWSELDNDIRLVLESLEGKEIYATVDQISPKGLA